MFSEDFVDNFSINGRVRLLPPLKGKSVWPESQGVVIGFERRNNGKGKGRGESQVGLDGREGLLALSTQHNPEGEDDKEIEVSLLVSSRGRSKESILKEIAKCDVMCSNCHRILYYEERLAKRGLA